MNCCKNEKGSFPHNQDIDLGVQIPSTQTWKLEFTGINGTKLELSVDLSAGNNLIIPKGWLNEDMYYCMTAHYYNEPDSADVYLEVNECRNFCFKTYIQTNVDCGNTCPPEPIL